jgi:hypothetical protein
VSDNNSIFAIAATIYRNKRPKKSRLGLQRLSNQLCDIPLILAQVIAL